MSLKAQFKTEGRMETEGIWIDYHSARILAARAGGSNSKFQKTLTKRTRHMRRALAADMADEAETREILRSVYADAVVLAWETKLAGKWCKGIDPEDAGLEGGAKIAKDLLPCNKENVIKVFKHLPEMFFDFAQQAQNGMLYREDAEELAVKN